MSDTSPAGTPAATPAQGTSAPAAAEAKPAQVTGRRGRRERVGRAMALLYRLGGGYLPRQLQDNYRRRDGHPHY